MKDSKKIGVTELVLRDAHQSLLATRFRYSDMESVLKDLDSVGFWSVESWGGAIFDSCIRYLGEDPWERIRKIKSMMPNTPQQMLLRGQNLLGYKHYSDDVLTKARLKMAYMPEKSILIDNPVSIAPGFYVENVFVFPGVPEILKVMFREFISSLDEGDRYYKKTIATNH